MNSPVAITPVNILTFVFKKRFFINIHPPKINGKSHYNNKRNKNKSGIVNFTAKLKNARLS